MDDAVDRPQPGEDRGGDRQRPRHGRSWRRRASRSRRWSGRSRPSAIARAGFVGRACRRSPPSRRRWPRSSRAAASGSSGRPRPTRRCRPAASSTTTSPGATSATRSRPSAQAALEAIAMTAAARPAQRASSTPSTPRTSTRSSRRSPRTSRSRSQRGLDRGPRRGAAVGDPQPLGRARPAPRPRRGHRARRPRDRDACASKWLWREDGDGRRRARRSSTWRRCATGSSPAGSRSTDLRATRLQRGGRRELPTYAGPHGRGRPYRERPRAPRAGPRRLEAARGLPLTRPSLEAEVDRLEGEMQAPGFWDDQESAQTTVRRRTSAPRTACRPSARWRPTPPTSTSWRRWRADDPEIAAELELPARRGRVAARDARGGAPVLAATTTRATPWSRSARAPAAPTPRTGPRCCCGCTCAGPSGADSTSR